MMRKETNWDTVFYGREVEAVVGEKALEELSHWRRYFSLAGPARLRSTMTHSFVGHCLAPTSMRQRSSANSKWSQGCLQKKEITALSSYLISSTTTLNVLRPRLDVVLTDHTTA